MKHIDDLRYQRQSRMTSYNNDKIKSISYNNSVSPKFFFFFFKCNFSNVQISQTIEPMQGVCSRWPSFEYSDFTWDSKGWWHAPYKMFLMYSKPPIL